MRQGKKVRRPMAEAERNTGEGNGDNAQENSAAEPARHQNGDEDQTRSGEQNFRIRDFSEADEGGGIGDDDFCVAQTNKRNKEADARSGSVLKAIGNGVDDLLTDVADCEQQKKYAREKDDAKGGLPRHAATEHDRVSEVRVERHTWRESDRVICIK